MEYSVEYGGRTYTVRVHHIEQPTAAHEPIIVVLSSTQADDLAAVVYQVYALVSSGINNGTRWAVLGEEVTDPDACLTAAKSKPWSTTTPDVRTKQFLYAAIAHLIE